MESISIFDIIKVGIGPSSSHTMGPWLAGNHFQTKLANSTFDEIQIHLYGSLAKTGKGHGTDIAVVLGLAGYDFTEINGKELKKVVTDIKQTGLLRIHNKLVPFDWIKHLIFHSSEFLPQHPNGLIISALNSNTEILSQDYYSLGGGFITIGNTQSIENQRITSKYPCHSASTLLENTKKLQLSIPELVLLNEQTWFSLDEIETKCDVLKNEMIDAIYRGVQQEGILPGGLKVQRRAKSLHDKLMKKAFDFTSKEAWIQELRQQSRSFEQVNKWISCFALAVNEENADFGRIVTAPTNGASGVLPAVLMYAHCFLKSENPTSIRDFILTAGEIGTLFKKNATISAAMGGCQAEVGVSASMAAAGLVAYLGGTDGQILMAAEIAMEHHLGLTCDPIGGLVQIPCIERNSMGAIKAITAAHMALESNPEQARVTLDNVIQSMWETAQNMHSKYRETSEGGLASIISVNLAEC